MTHLEDKLKNDAERFKKQIESEKLLAQYKKIQFELYGKDNGTEIAWSLNPVLQFVKSLERQANSLKWKYDEAETEKSKASEIKWYAENVYDLINENSEAIRRLEEKVRLFHFSAEEIESYQKENEKNN